MALAKPKNYIRQILMKKYLLLVRHAETHNNAYGNKFSGIVDTPLTDKGQKDAIVLADRLSSFNVEVVLTSKLERARKSAELLFPKIPRRICNELLEFDYGKYDGLSPHDLSPDDTIVTEWIKFPGSITFPCGQNIAHYTEEMWEGMHRLINAVDCQKIACILHKTMGRLFISKILQLDLNRFRSIPMDNCSVSIVTWDSLRGFELNCLNIMCKLVDDMKETVWSW